MSRNIPGKLSRFLHTKLFMLIAGLLCIGVVFTFFVPTISQLLAKPAPPLQADWTPCGDEDQLPNLTCSQVSWKLNGEPLHTMLYLGPDGFYDFIVTGHNGEVAVLQRYPHPSKVSGSKAQVMALLADICEGTGHNEREARGRKAACADAHHTLQTRIK